MTKKRSLGVTLLGWFEIVMGGGSFLLVSLHYIIVIAYYQAKMHSASGVDFEENILVFLETVMVFCIFGTVFLGAGILKLKKWAWKWNLFLWPCLSVCLYFIIYIQTFYHLQEKKMISVNVIKVIQNMPIMLSFLFSFMILYYLTRPKVRAQFFKPKHESQNNHPNQEGSHDRPMD